MFKISLGNKEAFKKYVQPFSISTIFLPHFPKKYDSQDDVRDWPISFHFDTHPATEESATLPSSDSLANPVK